MNRAMAVPTVNCTVVMFMGYGKAFKTCRAQGTVYRVMCFTSIRNNKVTSFYGQVMLLLVSHKVSGRGLHRFTKYAG
jgi:hypothetical protein